MIEKGVPVKAIEIINQTLKSGELPPELAAKALLMRAQAQEKVGKQAYALADYNQALWMQGLSANDKALAEKGRDRVLGKLGVNTKTVEAAPAPAPAAAEPAGGKPRAAQTWDTDVQTTPSEQRTGGIGSIFSGIFGSSDSKAAEVKPQPEQQRARPAASAPPTAAPVQRAARPQAPANQPPPKIIATVDTAGAAPARADAGGNFAIQFAALLSEDGAISEVNRIAKRYGGDLGGRSASVKIAETADGGTLYKVIAAPYNRSEGTAICELLKTKGVACMLITK
ncbi:MULTISPECIES: SPOR domain-containing protein [Rhodomicrobium]|uniref:SPOR domain-containing protein n=1 Tax=Rhodomicrobium TaxID=1068 RepID=UPI000F73C577|nr:MULTISPECIES: SPOR domain-containing protein [Rhodomicrobium]